MLTDEKITEDVSSSSSNKTRRDATHVLVNPIDCDQEDEEDWAFMQVFQELTFICGVDYLIIISTEDLRNLHAHLDRKTNSISRRNIIGIKKLQLYLTHLQQREDYEIGSNFNYSSTDEMNSITSNDILWMIWVVE